MIEPRRHRFHAICPYFAMFPENFAEQWIGSLTKAGDLVLDPFSGRGTAIFQANLMGRAGLGCDINPVAYVLSRAKTNAPPLDRVSRRLRDLRERARMFGAGNSEDLRAEFGDNAEFFLAAFAAPTLRQLLFLREELDYRGSFEDCMIAAILLGVLHGESERSSYYLSNQMPRTISTKPRYSLRFWRDRNLIAPERDVFSVLADRIQFRYASAPPNSRSAMYLCDIRELPRQALVYRDAANLVLTSPPYLDTTSFEEDQWLRLWFLGGSPYPRRGNISRDDRHVGKEAYWQFIGDMWRVIGLMSAPKAHVVIRLAGKGLSSDALADGLEGTSVLSRRAVTLIGRHVSPLQKRQTRAFRPGAKGLQVEVDVHFQFRE